MLNEISKDIYCLRCDCIDGMVGIPDRSVDLLLTDPPYNLGRFMKHRNSGVHRMRSNHFSNAGWDNLDQEEWELKLDEFLYNANRVLKLGGSLVIFMSIIKVETVVKLAQRHGFYYKTTGIWHKRNPMPRNMKISFVNSTESWIYFVNKKPSGTFNGKGRMWHDHFETSITPKSEKDHGSHPTQKPLSLLENFIELLSHPGDVVLDPFMGCGSTGIAAKSKNRRFCGFEISQDYYDIAVKRMQSVI